MLKKSVPEIKELVAEYFAEKGLPLSPAVTFDDVITDESEVSEIGSRSDITDLRAQIAKNFFLNIPIVSANMDTVTDSRLAIALARLGGMGFVHQFFSLDQRVEEVKKVKRADNAVIESPATVGPSITLGVAKNLMSQYQISCLLVVDENNVLLGILTSRDIQFCSDSDTLVKDLMTSQPLVTAPKGIASEQAARILKEKKIEKLPLVDSEGKVVGLMTGKDILKRKKFPNAARDRKGRLVVGATLRLNSDYLEESKALLGAGADVLLLDTARGGAVKVSSATAEIKKHFPNSVLVVGNTTNPKAVLLLAEMGADCVKIGVGPGAGCKTQEQTGVGCPQLYAIARCAAVAKKAGVYLIADGGIKSGGHLEKAVVAGANAVMIGSLFAGTDESPGIVFPNKSSQLVKKYRGSASLDHQLDRIRSGDLDAIRNPEGEQGEVPYVGSLVQVVGGLLGGLRSGMSYLGARNLEELWKVGKFLWRTRAAAEEGKPRI